MVVVRTVACCRWSRMPGRFPPSGREAGISMLPRREQRTPGIARLPGPQTRVKERGEAVLTTRTLPPGEKEEAWSGRRDLRPAIPEPVRRPQALQRAGDAQSLWLLPSNVTIHSTPSRAGQQLHRDATRRQHSAHRRRRDVGGMPGGMGAGSQTYEGGRFLVRSPTSPTKRSIND